VTRYAALLRGINVGGKNKVSMSDLRATCAAIGLDDVQTYIQSGNVVFSSSQRSTAKLETSIEDAIRDDTGLAVTVMIRSARDLAQIADHNPYAEDDLPATQLVVAFLKARPTTKALDLSAYGPETAVVRGTDVFLHYPNGQGRSKVTNAVLERLLGTPVTARNWNTVGKLLTLTSSGG
jgi:uncharacterized protein (DUF1697 family)